MTPVGDQRGRAHLAAMADQHEGPCRIQDRRPRVDQEAAQRGVQHMGCRKPGPGLFQDEKRRQNDHDAFQDGAEQFGFVVAVGVGGIGGPGCHIDRHQGGNRGHQIDDAFQRIRQQGDRTGHRPSQKLEPQHHQAQNDAADPEFYGFGHGRSFLLHRVPDHLLRCGTLGRAPSKGQPIRQAVWHRTGFATSAFRPLSA